MKKPFALCLVLCAFLAGSLRAQNVSYPDVFGQTNSRKFPYSMIGQLEFDSGPDSYVGSGTVIRANSVLTAAHNLWDPYSGWSVNILFTRSRYNDNGLSQQYANRKFILAGYAANAHYHGPDDIRAFRNDMGGLRFATPVADGAYAGWWPNPNTLLDGTYTIAFGYGAENHSGDVLLYVVPNAPFYQTLGGFYENESFAVEGGMTGGPVFARYSGNGQLYVVAVIVAGSDNPISSGVRVI